MLTMEAYRSKLYSSLFLKLRDLTPLRIPTSLCEGPIYLVLLLSHHLYALFLIDVEYECDWISFAMNYNV